jgi:hypothetical protein
MKSDDPGKVRRYQVGKSLLDQSNGHQHGFVAHLRLQVFLFQCQFCQKYSVFKQANKTLDY